MALKFLSLQMLLWCFNPDGPPRPSPTPPSGPSTARLIGLDGRVTVYKRRVKVADLMREHTCHLVCRSDSFFIGQKVPALSEADELQLGHSYFLLPSQFFQSVLSFVTIASSLAKGGRGSLRHFDIHLTDTGKLQIRIGEEEEETKRGRPVCTTLALEKEYEQLVGWKSRQWKPKLERIVEVPEKRRRRGGKIRFGLFGGFRRKKGDFSLTKVAL
ncbi:uncharacterized protein LOC110100501 [Dendrobium catenatum]|uniref:Uncharacterized protein n=3 Tax=Dendrobium TaxID=37818 RepID=A0A8T3BYD0_DENNO|nr:uncharacterized protein LOC110100501 [Dendrobium catenatum]KAH0466874.1 hypothetical protein IEQ34_004112 [Dendrobium chrysotoxum]KAI0522758.1 hypothetical protein KFK09_005143 [Dendrobium nobile]PKU82635.1 hypothetical protein MA16_Dca018793 [Dendrobium catenatum]